MFTSIEILSGFCLLFYLFIILFISFIIFFILFVVQILLYRKSYLLIILICIKYLAVKGDNRFIDMFV